MEEDFEPSLNDEQNSSPPNQWAIRCCAVLIIVVFITALIVGYASWFFPYPSPFP